MERRKAFFSGRVQGVGFRYNTVRIAAPFAVTGFVRNLPDGRVELVAEGEASEIDAFFAEHGHLLKRYITEVKSETLAATGEYDNFDTAF